MDEQAATISDLRSKMRQMVERHREMSSRVAELQEQLEREEDTGIRISRLSDSAVTYQAKARSLQQELDEMTGKLEAAQEQLAVYQEQGEELAQKTAFREEALSEKVMTLESEIQELTQVIEAPTT